MALALARGRAGPLAFRVSRGTARFPLLHKGDPRGSGIGFCPPPHLPTYITRRLPYRYQLVASVFTWRELATRFAPFAPLRSCAAGFFLGC